MLTYKLAKGVVICVGLYTLYNTFCSPISGAAQNPSLSPQPGTSITEVVDHPAGHQREEDGLLDKIYDSTKSVTYNHFNELSDGKIEQVRQYLSDVIETILKYTQNYGSNSSKK